MQRRVHRSFWIVAFVAIIISLVTGLIMSIPGNASSSDLKQAVHAQSDSQQKAAAQAPILMGLESGGSDYKATENLFDKQAAIIGWVAEGDEPVPGLGIRNVLNEGKIPLIAWTPPGSLKSIAAGAQDERIIQYAKDLQKILDTTGGVIYLRFFPEMNDGRYFKDGSTPADLVKAFQRTSYLTKQNSGEKIRTIWNPLYTVDDPGWQHPSRLQSMYPGDAYVDDVGIDVYDWCKRGESKSCPGASARYKLTLEEIRTFTDKPVILPEVGTGVTMCDPVEMRKTRKCVRVPSDWDMKDRGQWMEQLMADAKRDGIRAVVYFDQTDPHNKAFPTWGLNQDKESYPKIRKVLHDPRVWGGGDLSKLENQVLNY